MSALADAIAEALHKGRRVVVEHFDLVYPLLGANANLLIGVGEQVLIARPNIFGPEPEEIREAVYKSLPYRLMAHTAEDLCEMFMPQEDLTEAEAIDAVERVVEDSVNIHKIGDVEAGSFLSGGLNSNYISNYFEDGKTFTAEKVWFAEELF